MQEKPTHIQLPIKVWNIVDSFLGQCEFRKVEGLIDVIRKEMRLITASSETVSTEDQELPDRYISPAK